MTKNTMIKYLSIILIACGSGYAVSHPIIGFFSDISFQYTYITEIGMFDSISIGIIVSLMIMIYYLDCAKE